MSPAKDNAAASVLVEDGLGVPGLVGVAGVDAFWDVFRRCWTVICRLLASAFSCCRIYCATACSLCQLDLRIQSFGLHERRDVPPAIEDVPYVLIGVWSNDQAFRSG